MAGWLVRRAGQIFLSTPVRIEQEQHALANSVKQVLAGLMGIFGKPQYGTIKMSGGPQIGAVENRFENGGKGAHQNRPRQIGRQGNTTRSNLLNLGFPDSKSSKKWSLAKMGNRGMPVLKLVDGRQFATLPAPCPVERP